MKSVLIIVGHPKEYGFGHLSRMRAVALALKRKKNTVQLIIQSPGDDMAAVLPYDVAILDRRDTGFAESVLQSGAKTIAVDNRGRGRDEALLAYDMLPHPEMKPAEFRLALKRVIILPELTNLKCKSHSATLHLHNSIEEANAAADFCASSTRLTSREFLKRLVASRRPALYFGQALFEAIYLGLGVQLFSISEYHRRLAVDLYSRTILEPDILAELDGTGMMQFMKCLESI